jgi:hypothetical protein
MDRSGWASASGGTVARELATVEEGRGGAAGGEDIPRRPAATIDRGFLTSNEATSRAPDGGIAWGQSQVASTQARTGGAR